MSLATRVRFAPSPTGFMHLGNVRAALMNYLFARQQQGAFILRIEDTDMQRNIDVGAQQILADLAWLHLGFDEGPAINGPHAPYFQSERFKLYQEYLEWLKLHDHVYRCFCTAEDLEKKRARQLALKMPPRYDRTCLKLTQQQVEEKLGQGLPFMWRFKLSDGILHITDLARGVVTFDLKNFSDFGLTRPDGSFTFIFANFVDDMVMKITHIFRGEDHLSNTALQAALYEVFKVPLPVFWHLPIICNAEGRKLSKRDFGFSLTDLRNAGYLPEAIDNYLAIIGASFENEIMSLDELSKNLDFAKIASAGQIHYDLDKLKWLNHKWIGKLTLPDLATRIHHFLVNKYPAAQQIPLAKLEELLKPLQNDLTTLLDAVEHLEFYFNEPTLDQEVFSVYKLSENRAFFEHVIAPLAVANFNPTEFLQQLSRHAKETGVVQKDIYALLRIALTGKAQGLAIKDLLAMLEPEVVIKRLQKLLK